VFKIQLVESANIDSKKENAYFIEASHSCNYHAMTKLEHIVADLLQQGWIFWFDVILRRQRARLHSSLRQVFESQGGRLFGTSLLRNVVPWLLCT
jgi:hypothetical protein